MVLDGQHGMDLQALRVKAERYMQMDLVTTAQLLAEAVMVYARLGGGAPSNGCKQAPQDLTSGQHALRGNALLAGDEDRRDQDDDDNDVLRLARAYYRGGMYSAAVQVLTASTDRVPSKDPVKAKTVTYMLGKCLFASGQYEQTVALLTPHVDASPPESLLAGSPMRDRAAHPRSDLHRESHMHAVSAVQDELSAALLFLCARAHEELENNELASDQYLRALHVDPLCYDALRRLVDGALITAGQICDVVQLMLFAVNSGVMPRWACALYLAHLGHDASESGSDLASIPLRVAAELQAKALYEKQLYATCVRACERALGDAPRSGSGGFLLTYAAALYELDRRTDLFSLAHRAAREHAADATSWTVVAYYYMLCNKLDLARRYLRKATSMNVRLAQAWLAFGHCFAMQQDSDQAMAAYRTAARLAPQAPQPIRCMGAEYSKQLSYAHAKRQLQLALELSRTNTCEEIHSWHELALNAYRHGNFTEAIDWFDRALDATEKNALALGLSDAGRDDSIDGNAVVEIGSAAEQEQSALLYYNAGQAYRRARQFERALQHLRCAQRLGLRSATLYASLGMVLHVLDDLNGAVDMYHLALEYDVNHALVSVLLDHALEELFSKPET